MRPRSHFLFMKNLLKTLPWLLIGFRFLCGPIICLLVMQGYQWTGLYVALLWAGLISDIFDGIVARQVGVSSRWLRIADSKVDVFFWVTSVVGLYLYTDGLFESSKWFLLAFAIQEPMPDLILYTRFRKQGCAHNWASKHFGLWLLASFTTVFLTGGPFWLFNLTLFFGLVSQWDRIIISLLLPAAECDIPSFWHALQRKNGVDFKRYKLFN
jgi:phosphatidylglycerophosphate synthase